MLSTKFNRTNTIELYEFYMKKYIPNPDPDDDDKVNIQLL